MKTVDFKDLILFENQDYIVINKPPYVSSLDERDVIAVNVLSMARSYWPHAQLCHRLDKETSGSLAIAKNPEAYRNLSMQFENREVRKMYHAVADGVHDFVEHEIYLPIYKMANGFAKVDKEKGKEALTYIQTLRAYKKHTLLQCMPVTGRLHQIRVHLASVAAPIACDDHYGGKPVFLSDMKKNFNLKKDTEEQSLMKRVALHAFYLEFIGLAGETIKTEAPYPKDFNVLVKQLEKYS